VTSQSITEALFRFKKRNIFLSVGINQEQMCCKNCDCDWHSIGNQQSVNHQNIYGNRQQYNIGQSHETAR